MAVAGPGSLTISWASPASAKVLYKTSAAASFTEWTPGVNDVSPTTITGLVNGTAHVFTVAAFNQSGPSANSASRSATPRTIPAAPVLNVAASTVSSVGLAWAAPVVPMITPSAPVITYEVAYRMVGSTFWEYLIELDYWAPVPAIFSQPPSSISATLVSRPRCLLLPSPQLVISPLLPLP